MAVKAFALENFGPHSNDWGTAVGPDTYYNFDMAFHGIFHDSGMDGSGPESVGLVLRNSAEYDAVSRLLHSCVVLLEEFGAEVQFKDVVGRPAWRELVRHAKLALVELNRGNIADGTSGLPEGNGTCDSETTSDDL